MPIDGKVAGRQPAFASAPDDHALRVAPDLGRIMLDPAGLRIDLRMLLLRARDDVASRSNTMKRVLVVP